jgi:Rieske Fe-S protein
MQARRAGPSIAVLLADRPTQAISGESPRMRATNLFAMLSRRRWIQILLLGSVINRTTGKSAAAEPRLLTTLAPSVNDSAIIPVRLSQFPALQNEGGSIALYFSNYRYPMVINRGSSDDFYAVDPTCTHQGCQVGNYNAQAFSMECDCHGSTFDIQGRVTGGPAGSDLPAYRTQYDGNDLIEIELPGVPLRIDSVTVQARTPSNTRLRLQFPGVSGCKYGVRYYADLTSEPVPTLFATSATGNADLSFHVVGYASDGPVNVWLDAPGQRGFFAVEMFLDSQVPL